MRERVPQLRVFLCVRVHDQDVAVETGGSPREARGGNDDAAWLCVRGFEHAGHDAAGGCEHATSDGSEQEHTRSV